MTNTKQNANDHASRSTSSYNQLIKSITYWNCRFEAKNSDDFDVNPKFADFFGCQLSWMKTLQYFLRYGHVSKIQRCSLILLSICIKILEEYRPIAGTSSPAQRQLHTHFRFRCRQTVCQTESGKFYNKWNILSRWSGGWRATINVARNQNSSNRCQKVWKSCTNRSYYLLRSITDFMTFIPRPLKIRILSPSLWYF